MRALVGHILVYIVITTGLVKAQNFGNEWIDYTKNYYKIKVVREGIYRIPYATLISDPVLAQEMPLAGSGFVLYNKGRVVPIYVSTNGNFGSNDFIEFYGNKNDGTFDTQLFADSNHQLHTRYSLINDTAVYFLTWDNSASNNLIQSITTGSQGSLTKLTYCTITETIVYANPNGFSEGKPTYFSGQSSYEPVFDEGEGFCDQFFNSGSSRSVNIPSPAVYISGGSAHLKTVVVGSSIGNHRLLTQLNGTVLSDNSYNDFKVNKDSYTFPASRLNTSGNTLTFSALGTNNDRTSVSMVELIYPSQFNFSNKNKLLFAIEGTTGDKYMEIDNFAFGGASPILYDLNNNRRIVGVVPGSGQPLAFRVPSAPSSSGLRKLYLTSQSAIITVQAGSLQRVRFTRYDLLNNQGNYIILTHSKLLSDGGNNYIGAYAKYRGSQDGGNFSVKTILIDELYDQFAYGIRKHPLAIRRFTDYALSIWAVKPEYLFIIGKGRQYNDFRNSPSAYAQCLVPTFGHPASDNLLTATVNSIVPRVATGRLSVSNPVDIRKYYDKVVSYERIQREAGDPYQTIDNKIWMKRIMHMGGGTYSSEQQQFKFFLNQYENIIERPYYGGNVHSFFKTSSSPIQIVVSDFISFLINNGVSLITFFGHSSPGSFDFTIDEPENFRNFERYHFVLSNGCFTGNIYNTNPGISERFVLAEEKGAIGFASTISLSSSTALNEYSNNFYQNLSLDHYGSSVGSIMRKTIEDVEICCNGNVIKRMVAEEMTLHGDPAIVLNTHKKPDYALEPRMISFDPKNVTVESDSFIINVIVTNLGKAVDDSIDVEVVRSLPNGVGSVAYTKRIVGTYFSDTIPFTIATGASDAFGLNEFCITVDAGFEVDELSETNNRICTQLIILSDDVFPIYPYEFAIVPDPDITLMASTANAFAESKTYSMEIDTTELFNSPLKRFTTITQTGGVLRWKPMLAYEDSTVYYWRVGKDTTFRYSSFIYLAGSYPGWNQSHYYQYLKDRYNNMSLDGDRKFKYVGDVKTVSVNTGTADLSGGPMPWYKIAYHLNSSTQHTWICGGDGFPSGLTFAVFDSATGLNWKSEIADMGLDACSNRDYNTVHGNIHCKPRDLEAFPFPTGNCWQLRIINFINSIPAGNYVLVYSVNGGGYNNWGSNLKQAFTDLGAQIIPTNNNAPWAFFVQKGNTGTRVEVAGSTGNDIIELIASFSAVWNEGQTTTPLIGPAFEWGSFHWDHYPLESPTFDKSGVDIIGVNYEGNETTLAVNISDLDNSIQFIDASLYPFLKLRLNSLDDVSRTPTQLDFWRIQYDKVPDAALNPSIFFEFTEGPLNVGESLRFVASVENVTDIHMDSLLVKYTLVSGDNQSTSVLVRYDSLRANETMNLDFEFNTACNCLSDVNSLVIEVNPDNDQREQHHFNNIGILTFGVKGDNINPRLDVTFDGVHIMDGDIVSAQPEIHITLKDENKYLALDDTSLINVFITYPSGGQEIMRYGNEYMTFIPATLDGNNKAQVILKKRFEEDGRYKLSIQAKDRSRNVSGTYNNPGAGIDYKVNFEVITRATISNILNYPNPFTSSTRFVFTLTGTQVPTYMKIQIMTISGKIVKEITQVELGHIRVGQNLTDYAWNGTDEYGDPLANGLYLYRVVASINGEPLEKYTNTTNGLSSTDKYFHRGFGKMYLAR